MTIKRKGPLGDMLPPKSGETRRITPSIPQEDVDDRPNVGSVRPEDYPAADRLLAAKLTDSPKQGRKAGADAGAGRSASDGR